MQSFNRSKTISLLIYTSCFFLLLFCNLATLFFLDDYNYMYSFADGSRITHIGQIIPSMAAHAQTMNGRLVAHTFVQLFALAPRWFFDIANALMFALQIALIARIASGSGTRSNLLTIGIICSVWLVEPSFSHVNLWQDGSINYLWSVVFALLYLHPYIDSFVLNKELSSPCAKLVFFTLAFITGAYSENASAAVIFMAFLLMVFDSVLHKKKLRWYLMTAFLLACMGYISIYLAPAQWANKSVEPSLRQLIINFINATKMYLSFGIFLFSYVLMAFFVCRKKQITDRLILSFVFLLGSLAANYIMIAAVYYAGRSAVSAFILLLCANAILLYDLLQSEVSRKFGSFALIVLVLASIPAFCLGITDISSTYAHFYANEQTIVQTHEQGIRTVSIPLVWSSTKYGIAYDCLNLDTEDPTFWANYAMSKYYDMDSILGIHSPTD